MTRGEILKAHMLRWLHDRPDDAILNWLFRGLIVATIGVVAFDYSTLRTTLAERATVSPAETPAIEPLPPTQQTREHAPSSPLRTPGVQLRQTMSFELTADGRLLATGAIAPGLAKSFADEIDKRGSYVKTVVLQSPGGSVQDALAMGRLIREKGYATEVAVGTYCASSCPLVFAGGLQRTASKGAAIGVHQIYAAEDAASGMADGQRISAVVQKYLRDMGVDPGVWVHAMETPKEQLYYFKPDELLALRLATGAPGASSVATKR